MSSCSAIANMLALTNSNVANTNDSQGAFAPKTIIIRRPRIVPTDLRNRISEIPNGATVITMTNRSEIRVQGVYYRANRNVPPYTLAKEQNGRLVDMNNREHTSMTAFCTYHYNHRYGICPTQINALAKVSIMFRCGGRYHNKSVSEFRNYLALLNATEDDCEFDDIESVRRELSRYGIVVPREDNEDTSEESIFVRIQLRTLKAELMSLKAEIVTLKTELGSANLQLKNTTEQLVSIRDEQQLMNMNIARKIRSLKGVVGDFSLNIMDTLKMGMESIKNEINMGMFPAIKSVDSEPI